jgi:hypothetical protein
VKLRPMFYRRFVNMYRFGAVQRPIFELVEVPPTSQAHPGHAAGALAWFHEGFPSSLFRLSAVSAVSAVSQQPGWMAVVCRCAEW